ncbi:DUF6087 family protein [Streptomyces seoulensis]
MDDEPLSRWAERRDARIGQLRAVPLVNGGDPRGAHVNPDAPRAIQRWNGHLWEPYGFAANLAEAKRVLFPGVGFPGVEPAPAPAPKLGPGTGRHRRPQAPR